MCSSDLFEIRAKRRFSTLIRRKCAIWSPSYGMRKAGHQVATLKCFGHSMMAAVSLHTWQNVFFTNLPLKFWFSTNLPKKAHTK